MIVEVPRYPRRQLDGGRGIALYRKIQKDDARVPEIHKALRRLLDLGARAPDMMSSMPCGP